MSVNKHIVSLDKVFGDCFTSNQQKVNTKKNSLASLFSQYKSSLDDIQQKASHGSQSYSKKIVSRIPTDHHQDYHITINSYQCSVLPFNKNEKMIHTRQTNSFSYPESLKKIMEINKSSLDTKEKFQKKKAITKRFSKTDEVEITINDNPKEYKKNRNGTINNQKIYSRILMPQTKLVDFSDEEMLEEQRKKVKLENHYTKESKEEYAKNNKEHQDRTMDLIDSLMFHHEMKAENGSCSGKDVKQDVFASLKNMKNKMIDSKQIDLKTATNVQIKRTNPLFCEPKLPYLPIARLSDNFDSYDQYQKAFQPLMLNEYVSSINSTLLSITKEKSGVKTIKCRMRLLSEQIENDPCVLFELKKFEGMNILEETNQIDGFDLSSATNYMILISLSEEIKQDQINNLSYKNKCTFLGHFETHERIDSSNSFIVRAAFNPFGFSTQDKKWTVCYVRLVDKVTTFMREYNSLQYFKNVETNHHILKPRNMKIESTTENLKIYQDFMKNIKEQFNECQLAAINDICVSKNNIFLLQGPPGTGKTHTLIGIVSGIYHYLKTFYQTKRRHIMICAPSNAAIDEIILRIQQNGIYSEDGKLMQPKLVRVGVLDKDSHEIIKNCALETVVEKELGKTKPSSPLQNELMTNKLREEIDLISKMIDNLEKYDNRNKEKLLELYEKRKSIEDQYLKLLKHQTLEKEKYNKVVQKVLYSADLICCTLTSAGSEKLNTLRNNIEAVIVDEASQCTEPSNIIPFQYSPRKFILIGDPKQLPPTTFCSNAYATRFNRSLFERMIDCGINPLFLCEQYRMVETLRKFPSMYFYNGRFKRLTDSLALKQRPYPGYLKGFEKRNMVFLDLKFSRENEFDHSYYNETEIDACLRILGLLMRNLNICGKKNYKNGIGCISPYKRQVTLINDNLKSVYGDAYRDYITVNTIDAFQGQEKDVIILSTVRANPNIPLASEEQNLIGFLSDIRRLNVAITRPKFALIIIGNSNTLATNESWRNYISYLAENQSYFGISQRNQNIDSAIRKLFQNDKIMFDFTTVPDLPKLTPKKTLCQEQKVDNSHISTRESSNVVSPVTSFTTPVDLRVKQGIYEFGYAALGTDQSLNDNISLIPNSNVQFWKEIEMGTAGKKRKLNTENTQIAHEERIEFLMEDSFHEDLSHLFQEDDNQSKIKEITGSKLAKLFANTRVKEDSMHKAVSILDQFLGTKVV